MRIPEPVENPLLRLTKELDRLFELELPEEIREKLWNLLSDVQDYRRKQGRAVSAG